MSRRVDPVSADQDCANCRLGSAGVSTLTGGAEATAGVGGMDFTAEAKGLIGAKAAGGEEVAILGRCCWGTQWWIQASWSERGWL